MNKDIVIPAHLIADCAFHYLSREMDKEAIYERDKAERKAIEQKVICKGDVNNEG